MLGRRSSKILHTRKATPRRGATGNPFVAPSAAQARGSELLFSPFLFRHGSSPSTGAATLTLGILYLLFWL